MGITILNGITGMKAFLSSVNTNAIYNKFLKEQNVYLEIETTIRDNAETIISKAAYNKDTNCIYFIIECKEELLCTMFIAKDELAKNSIIQEYKEDEDIAEDEKYLNQLESLETPFMVYNSMLEENEDGTTDEDTMKIVISVLTALEKL